MRDRYETRALNDGFVAVIWCDKRPRHVQALLAGFPHVTQLSHLLHRPRVLVTPTTRRRLERLAEIVGFPPERIFVEGVERTEVGA